MVGTLLLGALALRLGLRLRRTRLRRLPRPASLRRDHLRFGKLALALLIPGFLLGAVSAPLLRGLTPFSTAHGWLATTTLALFVATFVLGRRLERGRARPDLFDLHAGLALATTFAALAAAFTGFVLLP